MSRLCQLDQAAGRLWQAWQIDTPNAYNEVFSVLCSRHDAAFDMAALRRDLEYEIAEGADVSLETVRLVLDSMLDGEAPPPEPAATKEELFTDAVSVAEYAGVKPSSEARSGKEPDAPDTEEAGSRVPPLAPVGIAAAGAGLEHLRSHACQLAQSLAGDFGLGSLVQEMPRRGIGYLLTDFPDAGRLAQCEPAERAKVSFLWWHLLAPCELTVMPIKEVAAVLPASSQLRSALTSDAPAALLDGIWTLDPGQVAHRFWHELEVGQWGQLMDLQEIYRTARRLFSPDEPLWMLR